MGKIVYLLLYFIFAIITAFANEKSYNEKIHYGIRETEDKTINYSPFFSQNLYSKYLIFNEDAALERASFSIISPQLFDLHGFLQNEFYPAFFCTHEELAEYENYFRYAYRALAISFLFEQTKSMSDALDIFGRDLSCLPDWHTFFNNCSPKTSDMRAYIKNIHGVLDQEKYGLKVLVDKKNEKQQKWINEFKSGQFSSVHERVFKDLKSLENNLSVERIGRALSKACDENTQSMALMCNEADAIYGMADQPLALKLLMNSDIFANLAGKSNVVGCLQRFALVNKYQETPLVFLNSGFALIYNSIIDQKQRYPQGRLFPAATLKFFEDKGLGQILKHEKNENGVVQAKPVKKEELKIQTSKPVVVKNNINVAEPVSAPKTKIEVIISAFKEASDLQKKSQLEKVEVDLQKFKFDFPFTSDQLKRLDKITPPFVSHKGLTDMKVRDHLGKKTAPLPLNLLKYLIEQENHQALYNILSVLGDKFFVINNVDQVNKNELNYIQFRNTENAHNPWQLFILNENSHTTSH